jgi:deoxyribonuclease II
MLQALNDLSGTPVDWWFIYKMPCHIGPNKNTKGNEYLYYDPTNKNGLSKSKKVLDKGQSSLTVTLQQIFNFSGRNSGNGYILYNDEKPNSKSNKSGCGHCKGILAFNKRNDSGIFILHSTPRFPIEKNYDLPEDELIYGQTYLCITLPDYNTANHIAEVLRTQQEPQVYASYLGVEIEENESLYKLTQNDNTPEPSAPAFIKIISKGKKLFQLAGKNRRWNKDFWIDLIGPHLGVDLNVESWRRGRSPGDFDSDGKDQTHNVMNIRFESLGLEGYRFAYTKDHSKWGVSTNPSKPWVCIADINRMVSQERRGGGALFFKEKELWSNLKSIENIN